MNRTGEGFEIINIMLIVLLPIYGPLAHLARAPALHAGGEGFDSPRVQSVYLTDIFYGNMICIYSYDKKLKVLCWEYKQYTKKICSTSGR